MYGNYYNQGQFNPYAQGYLKQPVYAPVQYPPVYPQNNPYTQYTQTQYTTAAPQGSVYAPVVPKEQTQQVIDKQVQPQIIKQQIVQAQKTTKVQEAPKQEPVIWKNDLRKLFQENKASIYAMIPRTFTAKDTNGDGLIEKELGEKSGTFLSAIERLDEIKALGFNTFHLLPIHPTGKEAAMGTAGSLYCIDDFLNLDPNLDDSTNKLSVKEEFKIFAQECHKRGIRLMIDLPSCASLTLYKKHPELMAIDSQGNPKVPQGWEDIRMFEPWADKDKRILNKDLLDLHKQYVDMCLELGIDGIRADVARAKPTEFWDVLINYAHSKDPNFAFLAESYVYEDASPMLNMPYDRPKDLLNAGFDSYYGQYHIFNEWNTAKEFHQNMIDNLEMTKDLPANKSLIGSFTTHDDKSAMSNGGVVFCNLVSGLMTTLPMTNPYMISGQESGDKYVYPYKDTYNPTSDNDSHQNFVHAEKIDIFNYSRKPGGKNPEIGQFFSSMMKVREANEDVITKGSYIPLEVKNNKEDKIISYVRHLNGKTLLVIANKDVNARQTGTVEVPTLKATQKLNDLGSVYGLNSQYTPENGQVKVDLGPGRVHIFEIDTPNIEKSFAPEKVYKQKLSV